MRVAAKTAIVGLVILTVALFLLRDISWTCSVALETTPEGFSVSGTSMTASEVDLGNARELPKRAEFRTLWARLPGSQSYSFSYSENADQMSIWLDRDLVYAGVPIPAFDAKERARAKRVGVRVEGRGSLFVRISDQCSLRGIASSLL